MTDHVCVKKEDHGWQKQKACLKEKPVESAKKSLFFNQSIEAERNRKRHGNPGQPAECKCKIKDSDCREPYWNPLQQAQAFTQENNAKKNAEQWVYEIAKACFHYKPGVDCPDIKQPVYAYEKRCCHADTDNCRSERC